MIDPEIKKLVLVRLEAMPDTIKVSLGGGESLGRDDLISHVKNEDEFGALIISMQIEYIKSFKKEVYEK